MSSTVERDAANTLQRVRKGDQRDEDGVESKKRDARYGGRDQEETR